MADHVLRMKATKALTYRTRRLLADGTYETTSRLMPGDVFEVVKPRDLRVLRATRKAQELRAPAELPPPPPAVAAKIEAAVAPPPPPPDRDTTRGLPDDLAAARVEYEAVLGKKPFWNWDAATLRAKIAAARLPAA